MIYTFPSYYKEFSCIADKCEATCCAGWQIVIDRNSRSRYLDVCTGKDIMVTKAPDGRPLKKPKTVSPRFRRRLLSSVHWFGGTFRQSADRRCAFLNGNNLCDLILNLGPDGLCHTCRSYPRHIEEFENMRQVTLSVSCPEAARILMRQTEPVRFVTHENNTREEYGEFDELLFSVISDCRDAVIGILQDRSLPVYLRGGLSYAIAHDVQLRLNHNEMFSCSEVYDKYNKPEAITYVQENVNRFTGAEADLSARFTTMKKLFERLYELEVLEPEWPRFLKECEKTLYGNGIEAYGDIVKKFSAYCQHDSSTENTCQSPEDRSFLNNCKPCGDPDTPVQDMHSIRLEQLLVYFISTYLTTAVYDGQVFSKVQMALVCTTLINELWTGLWIIRNKTLSYDDIVSTVYRFSREVEHSDDNLKAIEKISFDIRNTR